MKKNLLITTALVAVSFAVVNTPAIAEEPTASDAKVVSGKLSSTTGQKTHGIIDREATGDNLTVENNEDMRKGEYPYGEENKGKDVGGAGGALSVPTPDGKLTLNGGTFKNNRALYDGGAIGNYGTLTIKGTTFSNNQAHMTKDAMSDSNPVGGGAISLGSGSKTTIENAKFDGNTTGFRGGALATRRTLVKNGNDYETDYKKAQDAYLTIKDTDFIKNRADTSLIKDAEKEETSKVATGLGGAIATNLKTNITGGTFDGNFATTGGGAIYLTGFVAADNQATVLDKTTGDLAINGTTFTSNKTDGQGGAILSGTSSKEMKITGSDFTGNTAKVGGGAIWSGHTTTISGGSFVNNEVTGEDYEKDKDGNENNEGGGAIFVGSGSTVKINADEDSKTSTLFKGNKSGTVGGAIATRLNNDGSKSELTVHNALFEDNSAKISGGAINLAKNKTVELQDVQFVDNHAAKGGAININADSDTNVTFKGNIVFEGNYLTDKDGKQVAKNDINFEKKGEITVAEGASLTLDGGISCAGDSCNNAELKLEKGSTLSVNNETVIESTVSVNGSSSSSENARLKLRLAADSDNVFDLKKNINGFEDNGISNLDVDTTNNLYNITGENGVYTATQKSAGEVAANLGVKKAEADTVLGMMNINSTNAGFQKVQDTLAFIAQEDTVDSKEISRAADALGADGAPVVRTHATMLSNMIFDTADEALSDTLQNATVGQSSGDSVFEKAKIWVKGLFNYADKDDTSKAHGFDMDTYGAAMGVDKEVGNGKVGLGYAYSKSDIDGYTRNTDVKTHTAFVYGQYQPADWYVKGVAAYSWSDYKEKKSVLGENADSKYDVDTLALQGIFGYNFHVENDYDVTPEAGLRYLRASQDASTNALGVRVKARDIDVLTAVAGVKVAKNFALTDSLTIRPEVRAALTYDLDADNNDSIVTMGNTSYRVNGEKLERFGYELGAKLATDITSQWEVSAGYEGRFRDEYSDHTGMLSAKYKF